MAERRLLYSGPSDEHAITKVFDTDESIAEALASGWRLRRVDLDAPTLSEPEDASSDLNDPLDAPAPPEAIDPSKSSRSKKR